MRFNYIAYDKVFPRQEKPKPRIDPEDVMIEKSVKEPEEKKEAEDGTGTDGESDTE